MTAPTMRTEHDEAQRRVAGALRRCGAGPADRVALLLGNRRSTVDVALGALRAGVVPVPLDHGQPAEVLGDRLADAAVTAAVVDATRQPASIPAGVEVLDLESVLAAEPVPRRDLPAWPRSRPMHYTSGTTGRSKGVWAGDLGEAGGRALCEDEHAVWRFSSDDVHLVCSPLHHSAPLRFAMLTLLWGGRIEVLERFTASAALEALERAVTTTFMVPTHLRRLLDELDGADGADGRRRERWRLRWLAHAGAPCPEPLKRAALDRLPAGTLVEFYGSTEAQYTVIGPDEWLAHPGSVGRARPGRRLAVRDPDTGARLPAGAPGLVEVALPPAARFAYWRDPAKTARAWRTDPDGTAWLSIGDLGQLDGDGYLTLAGRAGDLVITGGVNVYPAEVERVLLAHPAVADGAVFGIPDDEWGERLCAAVVSRGDVDPGELRRWLRTRLAGSHTPKEVLVVDDLPRTPTGKVARLRLPEVRR